MGSVNERYGKLYLDFRYRDQRCREQSNLSNTPANKKRLNKLLLQIEAEIRVNSFNYEQYFPNSPKVALFSKIDKEKRLRRIGPQMLFETFAQVWFDEKVVEWRDSQIENIRGILDTHLLPEFGKQSVYMISKADIMSFRTLLATKTQKNGKKLSQSRINHIMSPLGAILTEAAQRFDFESPWQNVKTLKIPKKRYKTIQPNRNSKVFKSRPPRL